MKENSEFKTTKQYGKFIWAVDWCIVLAERPLVPCYNERDWLDQLKSCHK